MARRWAADTKFKQEILDVEQEVCSGCGRRLHVCDHRFHRVWSLQGPLEIVCKLAHCPDKACPEHRHTLSPQAETHITLPHWFVSWDLFAWMGHRRFARHWSVPVIQAELLDSYSIKLSFDAICRSLRLYQCMLAARQQDPLQLAAAYKGIDSLVLSIDGLQPEKGHETLYVVRELNAKRVWFALPLLSSSAAEIQPLVAEAKRWAAALGLPVKLWVSDKQDAFVTAIAAEFPDTPHRYCGNHFLRGLAKPTLEKDSAAKVKMRSKVRGLRDIERSVLDRRRRRSAETTEADAEPTEGLAEADSEEVVQQELAPPAEGASGERAAAEVSPPLAVPCAPAPAEVVTASATVAPLPQASAATAAQAQGQAPATAASAAAKQVEGEQVVLDYCAVVRGILNDDQGGPLHPPGLRMACALAEVDASLERLLGAKKGGSPRSS